MRIINAAVAELGMAARGKVFNNLDRYGNTSSASIPLALDEAHRAGLVRRGHHVLFSGFGAGLTWGTVTDGRGKEKGKIRNPNVEIRNKFEI